MIIFITRANKKALAQDNFGAISYITYIQN